MNTPVRVVVGVDGGGTKTRALALDSQGRELGVKDGPPGLVDPARPGAGVPGLEALIRGLVGDGTPIAALWVGLAGAGREPVRRSVEAALAVTGIAERVRVGTDLDAALQDALGDGTGILLIAGTGSAAVRRFADGSTVRCGGWGLLLGDEGSAYAIGLQGLRGVTRALDGRGPPTSLEGVLKEAAGLSHASELVDFAASAPKSAIAALAPQVLEEAKRGDPVAMEIQGQAIVELRALARTLADLPALAEGETPSHPHPAPRPGRIRVALSGGLICQGGPLRPQFEDVVRALGLELEPGPVRPERGAAALARSLLSI